MKNRKRFFIIALKTFLPFCHKKQIEGMPKQPFCHKNTIGIEIEPIIETDLNENKITLLILFII
jgi:hypothetical protein